MATLHRALLKFKVNRGKSLFKSEIFTQSHLYNFIDRNRLRLEMFSNR